MEMSLRFDEALYAACDRALKEIPANVHRKVLGQASRKSMRPIVSAARALVPRRTGLLRKSLGIAQRKYGKTGTIYTIVGPRTGFKTQTGATKGGRAVYANPVHYSHLVEKGTVHSGPHPFIRPAFDAHKGGVLSVLGREIGAGIDREAAKHPPIGVR